MQVDDIRLAMQFGGLVPRDTYPDLFSFLDRSDWQLAPVDYRDKLIGVAMVISDALHLVVESHIATHVPIVIEGDDILPGFAASVAEVSGSEVVLLANMLRRGRRVEQIGPEERQTETRGKALFSRWIKREASARGMPVLAPPPWTSLTERIASSIAVPPRGR